VVNTSLGVIGDIGKKTYNILMEDYDDSSPSRRINVCAICALSTRPICCSHLLHLNLIFCRYLVVAIEVKSCSLS